jgi:hypothetical protein
MLAVLAMVAVVTGVTCSAAQQPLRSAHTQWVSGFTQPTTLMPGVGSRVLDGINAALVLMKRYQYHI